MGGCVSKSFVSRLAGEEEREEGGRREGGGRREEESGVQEYGRRRRRVREGGRGMKRCSKQMASWRNDTR